MSITYLTAAERVSICLPYGLRRVPTARIATQLDLPDVLRSGDIALARLEKINKNTRLELANGRLKTLHEGTLLAVVFGNRYATEQFEGYARADGNACDLLSMGGLCGLVESKHADVAEPSKLRLLGALGDETERALHLREFSLAPVSISKLPQVIVVCGTSMDSGKTFTSMSLTIGLRRLGRRVGSIKLTGTSAGRDTWTMVDAGAEPAFDFVDVGFPSTYMSTVDELLHIYRVLLSQAAAQNAESVVIEVADGLLQRETSALLQDTRFTSTVNNWVLAAGDPMGAVAGVQLLRKWGIEPTAVSGLLTKSPLGMREVEAATGVATFTAKAIQAGALNCSLLSPIAPPPEAQLRREDWHVAEQTA